jgi:hypothetical protein
MLAEGSGTSRMLSDDIEASALPSMQGERAEFAGHLYHWVQMHGAEPGSSKSTALPSDVPWLFEMGPQVSFSSAAFPVIMFFSPAHERGQ